MTAPARRDAHSGSSRPASPWDHSAYERWLSGVEQHRRRPRRGQVIAGALMLSTLVTAWLTGVVELYVGWVVEVLS